MKPDARQRAREDYEDLVRAVFSTPAGQALLNAWRERELMAPTYQPGDDLAAAAHAEGGKAFIRRIITITNPPRTA